MRLALSLIALALFAAACSADTTSSTTAVASGPSETTSPVETPDEPSPEAATPSYAGTVPAPEFPAGLDWINSPQPLRLAELRGKVVLLDFWTYGCINCIHVIPDLKRLEEEYAEELVVIGVHSAKFLNEGETENIRQVVMRYGVDHPVVNDNAFSVWRNWGAQAWPTFALIDPAGNVVGMQAGEGVYDIVQPVIEGLIAEFGAEIDRTPFELTPERATQPNTLLSYPGKVAVDATGTSVFISDTGHNRVVVADAASGEVTAVYGSGRAGFENGSALSAEFDAPQGLAYDDATGVLYVADTNNHAIRAIDSATGIVTTVAGTGQLGWPPAAGLLDDVRLNSPWGLALRNGRLWVAMAGFHQIWVAELEAGIATPAVGSGREGVDNGSLVEATLAQPSGVAFDGTGRLFFADSESSSIRWADVFEETGSTGLLAGSDESLFDFGDADGTGTSALLQHPLGIVWDEVSGDLIIADTYNSKLKRIDPTTGEAVTYLGSDHGWRDGTDPQFYEPGGLALSGQDLYVADTNNHVIRRVELSTGETSTLVLYGIEDFAATEGAADYNGQVITLEPAEVAAGPGTIQLAIELPADHKVNDDAPSSVAFEVDGAVVAVTDGFEQSITGAQLPLDIDALFTAGETTLTADVTVLYCRADAEGLCIIEQVRFVQPLRVGATGAATIVLPHTVVLPNF